MAGQEGQDSSWQLALALIAAWRGAGGQSGRAAVAWRLAEAMAGGDGAAAADEVVLGLIAVGDMFLQLYADCAGASVDSVLRDTAALARDDQPLPPAQSRVAQRDPARETTAVSVPSGVEASKQLVRTYTQVVFNERQTDRAAEFFAPGVTWHGGTGGTVEGRDNVIALIRAVVGALDGLTATEQDMDAAGDTVAVRYCLEAVHSGELLGVPATGRRIRWEPTSVYRIAQGKIVHAMTFDNLAELLHDVAGPPRSAPSSAPTA